MGAQKIQFLAGGMVQPFCPQAGLGGGSRDEAEDREEIPDPPCLSVDFSNVVSSEIPRSAHAPFSLWDHSPRLD